MVFTRLLPEVEIFIAGFDLSLNSDRQCLCATGLCGTTLNLVDSLKGRQEQERVRSHFPDYHIVECIPFILH